MGSTKCKAAGCEGEGYLSSDIGMNRFEVKCSKCKANTGFFLTSGEAKDVWNGIREIDHLFEWLFREADSVINEKHHRDSKTGGPNNMEGSISMMEIPLGKLKELLDWNGKPKGDK